MNKLEGQTMSRIIFPGSKINMIAVKMIQKQPLNLFTFLEELTLKISSTRHTPRNPTGGGGGRAGGSGRGNGGGGRKVNGSGNDRNNDQRND